jgi:hypothetical protein
MGIFSDVRQLRFPREFRIAPVPWPCELELLLKSIGESGEAPESADQTEFVEKQCHLLADIGTGLWRLKQKMLKPGGDQPLDEMRRPYRHVESVWDALIQGGVEIKDHTDTLFDDGMAVKVVSFQPMPGLGRDIIIETIKPTIYFKEKHIQMGEVIVGRPLDVSGSKAADSNDAAPTDPSNTEGIDDK